MQDREASEGVMATPRSEGGNIGKRGHDDNLDEGTLFSNLEIE